MFSTTPERQNASPSQSLVKEVQDKMKILYAKHKRAAARRRWRCVRAAFLVAGSFKTKTKRIITDDACSGGTCFRVMTICFKCHRDQPLLSQIYPQVNMM